MTNNIPRPQNFNKKTGRYILLGVIALLILVVASQCFVIVNPGHTGIVVTLGSVEPGVMTEGLHFKIPLMQTVVQMDNRTQKIEAEGTASSKDLQIISYVIALNYRVSNDSSATLYKGVGNDYKTIIIAPAIQESIKAVTAGFTAEELITKRQQVSEQIKEVLSAKILPYGLQSEIFNIVNFDFSSEFNAAVEAKQTAQQAALKAEQDLVRIEVEAQQTVARAKAEAESIKLIQDTLRTSPEYIEYIKWSAWDGKLPNVMAGSDAGLMLDIGDAAKSASSSPANTVPTPTPTPNADAAE